MQVYWILYEFPQIEPHCKFLTVVVPTFPEFNCQTWVYGSSSHKLRHIVNILFCNSSHGLRFIFLLVQKFLNELTLFNVSSFMIYFSEKVGI
ncbi:hypothetical protein APS47_11505 [Leptospira kirschneri serovar Mozdok]|nr:hypothetical protein APS47_11505 [Leptospira kirschneri serovar Mozdok]